MMNLLNHYLVEINFGTVANNNRYLIGNVPQLKNVLITGIEVCTRSTYVNSINGNATIIDASGIALSLTYYKRESQLEELLNIPCAALDAFGLTCNGFMPLFDRIKVDLSKSYVTILDASAISSNQSILLSFYYEK
jgi:hypothetical protein